MSSLHALVPSCRGSYYSVFVLGVHDVYQLIVVDECERTTLCIAVDTSHPRAFVHFRKLIVSQYKVLT